MRTPEHVMNRFSYEFIQIIIWYWIGNGNVQTQRVKRKFRVRIRYDSKYRENLRLLLFATFLLVLWNARVLLWIQRNVSPSRETNIEDWVFRKTNAVICIRFFRFFFLLSPSSLFSPFFLLFFGFLYFAWLVLQEQRLFTAHRQETFLINREMYSPRDRE